MTRQSEAAGWGGALRLAHASSVPRRPCKGCRARGGGSDVAGCSPAGAVGGAAQACCALHATMKALKASRPGASAALAMQWGAQRLLMLGSTAGRTTQRLAGDRGAHSKPGQARLSCKAAQGTHRLYVHAETATPQPVLPHRPCTRSAQPSLLTAAQRNALFRQRPAQGTHLLRSRWRRQS